MNCICTKITRKITYWCKFYKEYSLNIYSMDIKAHTHAKYGVTILWQPDKCVHSGVCLRSLSAVFDPAKSYWSDVSKAKTARIVEQVKNCPGGALSLLATS